MLPPPLEATDTPNPTQEYTALLSFLPSKALPNDSSVSVFMGRRWSENVARDELKRISASAPRATGTVRLTFHQPTN